MTIPELSAVHGPGPSLDVWASFTASIDRVQRELAWQRDRVQRRIVALQPVKVTVPPITTNTTLDVPDLLGPKDGYVWDLHLVILAASFTGGTVTMLSGGGGTIEFQFSQAGMLQYGKAQLVLMPHDRLTFTTAALAGTAQLFLRGVQMELDQLPDYLI
jgi:hypothetical protein